MQEEEISEEVEEEDCEVIKDEVTLEISVHAPSRAPNFQTMQANGQVAERRLHILIDPSNTHNFLDQE